MCTLIEFVIKLLNPNQISAVDANLPFVYNEKTANWR